MDGYIRYLIKDKITSVFIGFGFNYSESQELTKYVEDKERLVTFIALLHQIDQLHYKAKTRGIRGNSWNINEYKNKLSEILEQYPERMFKIPTENDLH